MGFQARIGSSIPANRYLALVALIILALCLFELGAAFGVLRGPSVSSFFSSQEVTSVMTQLGYISLFALMTLESASLPIPSEIVLPFAGYLVYLGVMNLEAALVVSTLAALAGALIDYYLARILGSVFVDKFLKLLQIDHANLEKAERWFNQRGAWTVFGARFVPLIRSVISLPAGLFRMPLWSFALFTSLGCLLWNAVLIYAGYASGALWERVVGTSFSLLVNAGLVLVSLVCIMYLAYYAFRRL